MNNNSCHLWNSYYVLGSYFLVLRVHWNYYSYLIHEQIDAKKSDVLTKVLQLIRGRIHILKSVWHRGYRYQFSVRLPALPLGSTLDNCEYECTTHVKPLENTEFWILLLTQGPPHMCSFHQLLLSHTVNTRLAYTWHSTIFCQSFTPFIPFPT